MSTDICSICYDDVNISSYPEVLRPCMCTTPIHKDCVEKWINFSGQKKCGICGKNYISEYYRNYITEYDIKTVGVYFYKRYNLWTPLYLTTIFIFFGIMYFFYLCYYTDILTLQNNVTNNITSNSFGPVISNLFISKNIFLIILDYQNLYFYNTYCCSN